MDHLSYYELTVYEFDLIRSLNHIDNYFLDYLRDLKFTGQVRAIKEGTVFFPNEPVIEITAPLIEAQ